jgi:uncharacterized protein
MVWMVIGGPAIVVVAGFVTFYLAVSAPDPVLPTYGKSPESGAKGITHAPALQGRNHAATGELPPAAGSAPVQEPAAAAQAADSTAADRAAQSR